MTKIISTFLIISLYIACKHNNDKAESEYFESAMMLKFEKTQNLPFLLGNYMDDRYQEIVWSEHLIDEDSVKTQRDRQVLLNEIAKIDSLQSVCDSLFKFAFNPGSEKYETALKNRYSDSLDTESAIKDKQLDWESRMMADLLLKSYSVKKALQIVDSVVTHDFYNGNPPEWYIKHRETKLKRYKKEFGVDFK